jgi:hypothetical protein
MRSFCYLTGAIASTVSDAVFRGYNRQRNSVWIMSIALKPFHGSVGFAMMISKFRNSCSESFVRTDSWNQQHRPVRQECEGSQWQTCFSDDLVHFEICDISSRVSWSQYISLPHGVEGRQLSEARPCSRSKEWIVSLIFSGPSLIVKPMFRPEQISILTVYILVTTQGPWSHALIWRQWSDEALCLSPLWPISVPPGRKNPHIVFPSGGISRKNGVPVIG